MMSPETIAGATGASQRNLLRRATTVGLLMRHCANALVAIVGIADPATPLWSEGSWLLALAGAWSMYRIATRSHSHALLAADYFFVVGVCLAIPLLTSGPDFPSHNTAPVAIAGTSVIGFAVVLPARVTSAMTVGIATAFAVGCANTVGWSHIGSIFNLYYFAIQWVTIVAIRLMLLRVAAAVDAARQSRMSLELEQQVKSAVRDYDREQLALLHDTAASTLLMVGQGAELAPQRLAAQASQDLTQLREKPWAPTPQRIELAGALRQHAELLPTAVHFAGLNATWVDGDVATAVLAAAREVMNNVDRHSGATLLNISVSPTSVSLADNGIGFDTSASTAGHGIAESIVGRMRRAGGAADIDSAPGAGTRIALSWPAAPAAVRTAPPVTDPDQLIQRSRTRYGLALTAYAATNVIVMAPYAVMHGDHPAAQIALAGTAVLATLCAIPGIIRHRWRGRPPAITALLLVAVLQPQLLPLNEIGGQHYWAQGVIGWCLLPLLLEIPRRIGTAVLLLAWMLGSGVELLRAPTGPHWVNVGLGTASILSVQLFAWAFNSLMRDAAAEAHSETSAHQHLLGRVRVRDAVRAEYQNRYAALIHDVEPLLEQLVRGQPADGDLQQRARAQSRQLRALFDQASVFDHTVMRQLRTLTDDASARGVDTTVDVIGELPALTDAEIANLLAPLAQVLEAATSTAKVVLTAAPGEVTASIVGDSVTDPERLSGSLARCTLETDLVVAEGAVWLLVRHRLPEPVAVADTA